MKLTCPWSSLWHSTAMSLMEETQQRRLAHLKVLLVGNACIILQWACLRLLPGNDLD